MTATAVTTRTATMHEDLEKNQKTSQVCNIISFFFSQNFTLNIFSWFLDNFTLFISTNILNFLIYILYIIFFIKLELFFYIFFILGRGKNCSTYNSNQCNKTRTESSNSRSSNNKSCTFWWTGNNLV